MNHNTPLTPEQRELAARHHQTIYSYLRGKRLDASEWYDVAVFDFGHVATSEPIKYFYAPELVASLWHESQVYVMTINNHRFFKEVQHGQGNQEPARSCD